jgi:hypothetical protein
MKPPICEICDRRILKEEHAGLVYFQKTKTDSEWDKKCKEEGFVGHPPYAEWFCEEHYLIAKKYSSLPKRVALVSIKRELKYKQKAKK